MVDYQKPLPELTAENRPFWDACRERRLAMQRCGGCGHLRYPVSAFCPRCLSEQVEWVDLSGAGAFVDLWTAQGATVLGLSVDQRLAGLVSRSATR